MYCSLSTYCVPVSGWTLIMHLTTSEVRCICDKCTRRSLSQSVLGSGYLPDMFRFLLAVGGLATLFVWDGKYLGWDHAAGGGQLWLTLRCLTLTLEHSASFRKLWHIKANYCHPAVPYNANAYCSCGIITVASSEPLATLGLPRSSYCFSILSILKIHKIKAYMIFMLIYLLQS